MDSTTKTHISSNLSFPNQRVSASEKEKKRFYIPTTNYIIDRCISANNKDNVINGINAANGIIDQESIDYVLSAYGTKSKKNSRFPTNIRNIDIITPIKERYLGEYIKQYHNYQVYIPNSDALFERNEELQKALYNKLAKEFEELMKGNQESLEQLDIEKFVDEFVAEWIDEKVIKEQERLNFINSITESVLLYIEGFFYWWACEEVYSYRDIHNGDLDKEIIPPWEYYRVDSGNVFVEDDDMGMRKYYLSLHQILDKFKDELTQADIKYLETLVNKTSHSDLDEADKHLIFDRVVNINEFDKSTYSDVDHLSISYNDYSGKIPVYHSVWKTQTKIYELTYRDFMTGEIKTMDVPQDYKLNETNGDIEMEADWINEAYESYRLGGKFEGIYLKARPVIVQRPEINNNETCKLPYNGISSLIPYNRSKTIPQRLIEYQLLIRLYHYQREKAIAKFKSFNLMPESILKDSEDMTVKERLEYASMDDILPFNDEDIADPQVLNYIKSLYNQGAERYIQILTEVIASLNQEAMEAANMNQQRYGDINPRAGKSTTEYAITKATTGSILLFEMFNKFRERDYSADIDWSKAAWLDGKRGSFIDPDTKEPVYVSIDGIDELGTNVGVFIKNSAIEEEKLQQYKELAFSAAQNGDLSIAAEAIDSNNASKLKKLIRESEEARKEFETAERASKEKIEQIKSNKETKIRQLELEAERSNIDTKEINENLRKLAELEVKLEDIQQKYATDENSGILDEHKEDMDRVKVDLQKQKLELDRYKTQQQMKNQQQNNRNKS